MMTVGELRKALEGIPDRMEVMVYDEGYLSDEVAACVVSVAPLHPESPTSALGVVDVGGKQVLLVS